MKVVGLVSGGKDSCYNLMKCVENGHEIVCLANLHPPLEGNIDELDSYMYQTVGHNALDFYSEAMGLRLYRRKIAGDPVSISKDYDPTIGDEVEDLHQLLVEVKSHHPEIEAVSVGAIHSNYQKVRVENVCERLNLKMLAFLWGREQSGLMREMIDAGLFAIIIKVAALGLEPQKHLGLSLEKIFLHLVAMHEKYGLNVCGEGGEFESLALDCPLFKKRIIIDESEIVTANPADNVGYLKLLKMHLEKKQS